MYNAREQAILTAEQHATQDYKRGLPCEPARYGAKTGSAWAEWYTQAYARLAHKENKHKACIE